MKNLLTQKLIEILIICISALKKFLNILKFRPEDPQERASNGIFQILNEGNGLTAMPRPASGKPLKVFLSVMIESITGMIFNDFPEFSLDTRRCDLIGSKRHLDSIYFI